MNALTLITTLSILCLAIAASATDDSPPPAPAVECNPRAGLPNTLARLNAKQPLTIAYFGGSITAADGWRAQTTKWFSTQFPNSTISEINAAIGGTGSDLGVFRFARDVLAHNPNLVFIEFAVNDAGAHPSQIHKCIEGIVRQAWKHDPNIDICFVYTLVDTMVPTLANGQLPRSAAAMEQIAHHYAIPSIHMGLEVARLAASGHMIMKTEGMTAQQIAAAKDKLIFAADGVHPRNNTGHRLYTEAVIRSFQKINALPPSAPRILPPPFTPDHYEAAKLVPLTQASLSTGFQKLPPNHRLARSFSRFLPDLYAATQPGESLSFRFKGTYAGFYDLLGPDCGQLNATIDAKPVTILRFDSFSTYHRLGSFALAAGLPDTVHTLRVTVDSAIPDKTAILAKRHEKIDDPTRFEGSTWYVGWIMIIGEPLPSPPSSLPHHRPIISNTPD